MMNEAGDFWSELKSQAISLTSIILKDLKTSSRENSFRIINIHTLTYVCDYI